MIVGVDPENTTLTKDEVNKVVIKTLERLMLDFAVINIIKKYSDGVFEIEFLDGEGHEHYFYVVNGLVQNKLEDGLDRTIIPVEIYTGCNLGYRLSYYGRWDSECYEGCGCPCYVGRGYINTPVKRDHEETIYSSHCKDRDEKLIPAESCYSRRYREFQEK